MHIFWIHRWISGRWQCWSWNFQGSVQALSRSYFLEEIIPARKAGEFFGLYDICGKGAAVLGTTLVSVMSQITGKMNVRGVSAI